MAMGVAAITVAASLTVGAPPASAAGPTDHVTYWNTVLLQTYRDVGGAPGPLARTGAMMYLAVYDAANSVRCAERFALCLGEPYLTKVPGGGDFNTAIDYAAYRTLKGIYPSLTFDDELAAAQAGIPDSPQRAAGISVGNQTAAAVLQDRANDRSAANPSYPDGTVSGAWRRTGSGEPATPHWGNVRPFTMTSGSQFRPEIPGGHANYAQLLASPEYAEQFKEVKDYGAKNSTVRSDDQEQAAWFWANDLDGTYKPPGQLFDHTRIVADQEGLTVDSKVKLFAHVGMALADASILAWDAKYNTNVDLWRPESAIRLADTDNNAATAPDSNWEPLSARQDGTSFSPPFPAYVSGHSTFAYTWAEVMRHWFGTDDIGFTATTDDPHAKNVTREFDTFTQVADENAHSRLWLGVHFHFDADNVLNPGTQLGDHSAHARLGANTSDEELLFLHRDDASSRFDCVNVGQQLLNEHRWNRYRCEWIKRYTTFNLYVQ
jgi:hypothetical protein